MDDLLSNLPSDVLCYLLSFLTTKETALTSVLSKRWRNLIAFVPILDIEDYVYLNPEKSKEERDDSRQLFMDFVDRVLALQGTSPINKVSLHCNCVDSVRVDAWISNVLARNVSELDLSLILDDQSEDKYHQSPRCFQSKKLVKLKIAFGNNIGWLDGSVFLPMLKTLVLRHVWLSNDKFEILLHALPVLEELVLHYITFEGSNVTVSSASLKTLTTKSLVKTFSFNTPSLVYFCFTHYDVAYDYSVAEMENLIEARISFLLLNYDIITPFDDWSKFANAGKLMNGIRNVQRLYLSPDTIEVLSLCSKSMPVFKNLKSLTIKSDQRRGWDAMPVFLRNCPHLETLVLEGLLHHVTDKCGDACDCVVRETKGHSLTSCPIKVLKIQDF